MTSTAGLRRDPSKNREAILEAARELFGDSADVPMCRVARHAGVGQATLYRNFPGCAALKAEILAERVERIAELAALNEGTPDAFFVLLRGLVDGMARFDLLAEVVRIDRRDDPRLRGERSRIVRLIEAALGDSKAAGVLDANTSVEDAFLLLSMARGAITGMEGAPARSAAGRRTLTLILRGLKGPGPDRQSGHGTGSPSTSAT